MSRVSSLLFSINLSYAHDCLLVMFSLNHKANLFDMGRKLLGYYMQYLEPSSICLTHGYDKDIYTFMRDGSVAAGSRFIAGPDRTLTLSAQTRYTRRESESTSNNSSSKEVPMCGTAT